MGICKYCGQDAGFFGDFHPACQFKHDADMIVNGDTLPVSKSGKKIDEKSGWEISAHRAPSETHAKVQGCIFTDKEFDKLQEGKEAVDVEGVKCQISEPIGEGECKHFYFPVLIGISEPSHSKKELKELLEENERGIELQGEHFTLYQAKIEAERLKEQIQNETDKAKKSDLRNLRKELKEILETKAIRVK